MERNERIVVGAAAGLIIYTLLLTTLGPVVLSAVTSQTISNTGSVMGVGVGVYWNQAATNSVSSINWGIMEPGSNKNVTVYIRNEGTIATTLTLTKSSWNPSAASNYVTLNWNYGGQTLNANDVIQVKFTLTVSASVTGTSDFSFDIIITAASQ